MNDTPQGDGNPFITMSIKFGIALLIRMNDTPQGDGNSIKFFKCPIFQAYKNE